MIALAAAALGQLDDREQRELDEIDAAQLRIEMPHGGPPVGTNCTIRFP